MLYEVLAAGGEGEGPVEESQTDPVGAAAEVTSSSTQPPAEEQANTEQRSAPGSSSDLLPPLGVAPQPSQPAAKAEPAPPVPLVRVRASPLGLPSEEICRVAYHGGSITFYPHREPPCGGRFQANCRNPEHGARGRLTRTSQPAIRLGRNPAQGRPLGLLANWLELADSVSTKEEHDAIVPFLTHENRQRCWQELMVEPGGAAAANQERLQRQDEGPEPEGMA